MAAITARQSMTSAQKNIEQMFTNFGNNFGVYGFRYNPAAVLMAILF